MITVIGTFLNGSEWTETAADKDEFEFVINKIRGNSVSGIDKIEVEGDTPEWLEENIEDSNPEFAGLIENV